MFSTPVKKTLHLIVFLVFLYGCTEEKKNTVPKNNDKPTTAEYQKDLMKIPDFNPDSAFAFIEKQVKFGPRVPNTKEHTECAEYLVAKLNGFNWVTTVQEAKAKAFNGVELNMKNIIAIYNIDAKNRVALFAHWDSRPFADRDVKNRNLPILGANDGASGVGVLMEIARVISGSETKPSIGIDIILFDAEDYGQPADAMIESANSWCLGSQHWSKNPHVPGYKPKFGILLDMVGAANATFPMESNSLYFAPEIVSKVWTTAQRLGYGNYFIQKREFNGITDDHVYVNTLAKIPTIDIIHYRTEQSDFGEFHHRHTDNMEIIDKQTLHAVGHTLLEVLYREK